jgi:polar amino acid transport system ATP-binding protein
VEGGVGVSRVLAVEGLKLSRGAVQVLRGVDLVAESGEFVALMGLSGGGKTTVLRSVVTLEPFDSGTIDVDGFVLRPGPVPRERHLRELRRRVGMVFQMHYLFEHLPAVENIVLAPVHTGRMNRPDAEARAGELLQSLGVGHRAHAYPRELSGGEAQRVAIARALAVDPPLLLMDEPTASLDPARRSELGETLQELTRSGRTLVVTTHDDDFVRDFASRVVILAAGEVVESGPPSEVLSRPQHEATRALLRWEESRKRQG